MVAVEAVAYPALSLAVCGAYWSARGQRGWLAWARGLAVALMVGAMVAAQVRLFVVGLADSAPSLAFAAVGVAGALGLLALWARDATTRHEPAPG